MFQMLKLGNILNPFFPFLLDVLLSTPCPRPWRELPAPFGTGALRGASGLGWAVQQHRWERSSQAGDTQKCSPETASGQAAAHPVLREEAKFIQADSGYGR